MFRFGPKGNGVDPRDGLILQKEKIWDDSL